MHNPTPISFIDLFNDQIEVENASKKQKISKIKIPIIQRDYAQGRKSDSVRRVRVRFLNALKNAIINQPITLDFIFGEIDEKGVFIPLDGQQRLTTLFLLHWYAAKKENIPESEYSYLKNFTYETRYSARDFCIELVDFNPSFKTELSSEIEDQPWFPLSWKKDPTIASMLVMLNAIDDVFKDIDGIYEKLKKGHIQFYVLTKEETGLTDELYIKMNSRGKPLTNFEHFKAEFEQQLKLCLEAKLIDEQTVSRLTHKMDVEWTRLLFKFRGQDMLVDDMFLRYFKFICDIIRYKRGETAQSRTHDEFDLINDYFSVGAKDVAKNIALMQSYFDCFAELDDVDKFFDKYISKKHVSGKIVIKDGEINVFKDCINNYTKSTFPLNRLILLYAFLRQLTNPIDEENFIRRIRIVNNLIKNSRDEISDDVQRAGSNRLPAILAQVDEVLSGSINLNLTANFSRNQLEEENEKLKFTKENKDKEEILFELEDHELLYGQISIIGLDNLDLTSRFESLFSCNLDKVDCALMATGSYYQREKNGRRFQFGTKTNTSSWDNLFHKSANKDFDKTHDALIGLLEKEESFSNQKLDAIVADFISSCEEKNEYPWNYYYVKYPEFRPDKYGKYKNDNENANPYCFVALATRSQLSENSFNPFLKVVDSKKLSTRSLGQQLSYENFFIIAEESSFYIFSREPVKIKEKVEIKQKNGIDIENRIDKLKEFISLNKTKYFS